MVEKCNLAEKGDIDQHLFKVEMGQTGNSLQVRLGVLYVLFIFWVYYFYFRISYDYAVIVIASISCSDNDWFTLFPNSIFTYPCRQMFSTYR